MSSNAIEFYLEDIKETSVNYRPNWFPGTPLKIGDYGVLKKEVFNRKGNIFTDFGIEVIPLPGSKSPSLDFSSSSGISVTTKIKGKTEPKAELLGEADAGFIIEFNDHTGYIFKLKGYTVIGIENMGKIEQEVSRLFSEGKWNKDHIIIQQLMHADSATILISGESKTKLELKASADIAVGEMDIADAKMKLHYQSGSSLSFQEIGCENITPLYSAIGFDKSFFGKISSDVRGGNDKGGTPKKYPFIKI